MPRVSVVVPTYNRLGCLRRVLTGLENQHHPLDNFEVVVISDGSSDGTDDYLRAITTPLHLTAVTQPNRGVAAARNHGLECATGELVLFIDDDVVPTPQLITEHIRIHDEQPDDVIVLGPMLTPADFIMSPWVRWEQAMLIKQYDAMVSGKWQPTARQFYTGNTSLGHKYLIAAGGFDEAFRRAEDVELAYRLVQQGLRFVFNANAIGYHYADRSFRSWMETPYAYGRNDVIFTRDKHQTWLLPTIMSEFHGRNRLVKLLVRVCLDRAKLSSNALTWLKIASNLGHQLRIERFVRASYSAMFNLRYYQGVTDELGGREHFFAQVGQADV